MPRMPDCATFGVAVKHPVSFVRKGNVRDVPLVPKQGPKPASPASPHAHAVAPAPAPLKTGTTQGHS
jgi:hypothetical protein